MRLILASQSPQRRAILEQLGIEFEVIVPQGVSELQHGPAQEIATENAYRKATEVAARAGQPGALVLGVDTVVSLGSRLYGKPRDEHDARRTLNDLSGRRHVVMSGLCLIRGDDVRTVAVTSAVRFRSLEPELIDWYLGGGEWRGRAGGYAIQGRGAALISAIEGDYLNVVGLPAVTLLELQPDLLPLRRPVG